MLAGLAAQDPNAEVVGEAFTEEPYGIGVQADQVDLVRFVNGVLEEMRTNGRWAEHLRDVGRLGDPAPPRATDAGVRP